METVSPLEVLWTVFALYGAGICTGTMLESWHDLDILRASGRNGNLKLIAQQVFRNEVLRLIGLIVIVAIGIIAMLLPNTPGPFSWQRLLMAASMFVLEGTLVYGGWQDRITNRRLDPT